MDVIENLVNLLQDKKRMKTLVTKWYHFITQEEAHKTAVTFCAFIEGCGVLNEDDIKELIKRAREK